MLRFERPSDAKPRLQVWRKSLFSNARFRIAFASPEWPSMSRAEHNKETSAPAQTTGEKPPDSSHWHDLHEGAIVKEIDQTAEAHRKC
jgi:hypothetical protein